MPSHNPTRILLSHHGNGLLRSYFEYYATPSSEEIRCDRGRLLLYENSMQLRGQSTTLRLQLSLLILPDGYCYGALEERSRNNGK